MRSISNRICFAILLCFAGVWCQDSEKVLNPVDGDYLKYYLPSNIYNDVNVSEELIAISDLTQHNLSGLVLSPEDVLEMGLIDTTSRLRSGRQRRSLSSWSSASCCRRESNTQTRVRVTDRNLIVQLRRCSSNFCQGCRDHLSVCSQIRSACFSPTHFGFMTQFCPESCQVCTPETTTVSNLNLVSIRVYFRIVRSSRPYIRYGFFPSSQKPDKIWLPIRLLSIPGHVSEFFLSTRRATPYSEPLYICRLGNGNTAERRLQRNFCNQGWSFERLYYTSQTPFPNGREVFVSQNYLSRGGSRVFTGNVRCCGYYRGTFRFYSPDSTVTGAPTVPTQPPSTTSSTTTRRTTTTTRPTTTRRVTTTTRTTTTTRPTTTERTTASTTKQPSGGNLPTNEFDRNCLVAHNFFRSLHNVPPLQWDPDLARSSKRWADRILYCAPSGSRPERSGCASSHWPHSSRNTVYRGQNVGENIAWDASSDGSNAQESVYRWYFEIFDYRRSDPTLNQPRKPTGHYTQLIWRNSKKLGCAFAEGGTRTKYTWTVAQYSPGGNVRYPTKARTISEYDHQVPQTKSGTCRKGCEVNKATGCLGYDSSFRCRCVRESFRSWDGRTIYKREPQCIGRSGGCAVLCSFPQGGTTAKWRGQCRGERSCRCTNTPTSDNNIGAVCD